MGTHKNHRDNLVHAALRLFRRQGYSGTGLKEILALSHAPKGSLYHYFPGGKEALGRDAVVAGGEAVARTLDTVLKTTRTGDELVRRYLFGLAESFERSRFKDGCPIATTLLEMAPDSAPIADAGRAAIEGWVERISAAYLREGMSPEEARRKATLVIAVTEGALILARASRSAEPIRTAALELTRASTELSPR